MQNVSRRMFGLIFFALIFFAFPLFAQPSEVACPENAVKVFKYNGGNWKEAKPTDNASTQQTNYVIIHGSYSSVKKCPYIKPLAVALKNAEPDCEVFAVDWGALAAVKANPNEFKSEEELLSIIPEKLKQDLKASFKSEKEFRKNVSLWGEMLFPFIPVEQTKYIPEISKIAAKKLFGKETDKGQLALSPQDTHIIGHSHGAHIAGLIGAYTTSSNRGKIKAITALEPSPESLHCTPDNFHGNGWGPSSAEFIDVIKTSRYCSGNSSWGTITYNYTPQNEPKKMNNIISLACVMKTENNLHQKAWDEYIIKVNNRIAFSGVSRKID